MNIFLLLLQNFVLEIQNANLLGWIFRDTTVYRLLWQQRTLWMWIFYYNGVCIIFLSAVSGKVRSIQVITLARKFDHWNQRYVTWDYSPMTLFASLFFFSVPFPPSFHLSPSLSQTFPFSNLPSLSLSYTSLFLCLCLLWGGKNIAFLFSHRLKILLLIRLWPTVYADIFTDIYVRVKDFCGT